MSGGVDSAVALLAAGENAVGVTLRLWIDPAGPDAERACCSPAAVIAARRDLPRARAPARDARPARGVPPRRRRAVHARLRARRDAEPVRPLQRRLPLRRAARVRRSRGRRQARDRPLRAVVERAGRRAIARAADAQKDQSYMLAGVDPRRSTGSGSRSAGRRRSRRAPRPPPPGSASRAAPRARRRASSPATTTARSSSGTGSARRRAPSSTRAGARSGATRASGGSRPASAAGSASPPPSRSTRSPPTPGRTPSSSGRARRSRGRASPSAAASTPRRPGRGEAPLPLARGRGDRRPTAGGFELRLDEPAFGVAPGQAAVLYADDAVVGAGVITSATAV